MTVKLESHKARHPQLLYESKLCRAESEYHTSSEGDVVGMVSLCVCCQVVWHREGLQCTSDGPTGTQLGGPLQFLLKTLHHEDCPHAGRSGMSLQ